MVTRVISVNEARDDFPNILRQVSPNVSYEVLANRRGKPVAQLRLAFGTSVTEPITEVQAKTHFKSLVDAIGQGGAPVRIAVLGGPSVDLVAA